ncbi:MAG: YajQ family cyclic di-GMP-binding protein [Candidatus Methylomirabilia bacterium]
MPENSFDVYCKVEMQEVANAVTQTNKEIQQRYDLKGSRCQVTLEKIELTVLADDDMKHRAVLDILQSRLHRRGVPLKALGYGKVEPAAGGALRQMITLQQGIPSDKAREIVKLIKESKLKVQAQVQQDQVRVFGKSRDELQAVIAMLREQDLEIALQFGNYRSG